MGDIPLAARPGSAEDLVDPTKGKLDAEAGRSVKTSEMSYWRALALFWMR